MSPVQLERSEAGTAQLNSKWSITSSKKHLHQIFPAETKQVAEEPVRAIVSEYRDRNPKMLRRRSTTSRKKEQEV